MPAEALPSSEKNKLQIVRFLALASVFGNSGVVLDIDEQGTMIVGPVVDAKGIEVFKKRRNFS